MMNETFAAKLSTKWAEMSMMKLKGGVSEIRCTT